MNREQRILSLSEICPSVWVSPWLLASNKDILKEYNITHIVNASKLENSFPEEFVYLKLEIEDEEDENISKYFTKTSRFIHNAVLNRGKVLIHCFAQSRRLQVPLR